MRTHCFFVCEEAYPAYLGMDLPAAKSDLFRYCVLFTHGGLWADIDTLPVPTQSES